jgi:hypothetical protein
MSTRVGCSRQNMTMRAMSSASSAPVGRLSKNGVSTMPGSTTVTRTCDSALRSSWRSDSAMPVTAHLVDE